VWKLPNSFEVGIVGAGVAGASCAQVLGEAGVNVAIFDHSHPREKPCGGLIEERIVEEFDVPEELLENEIKWVLAERFKFRVKLSLKPSMFLISRRDFDYCLLQKALENKSVKCFNEKVNLITKEEKGWSLKTDKDRSVEVKILIGADGCPSFVRKHVSEPIPCKFLVPTVGYNFPCSTEHIGKLFAQNTVEAYYSNEYVPKMGFIWVFPKRTSINVGIGGAETGIGLKQSLDKFVFSNPFGKRFTRLKGEFFTHLVPIIWEERFFDLPCSGENWALIGDAAGHANPIGGAGIYYAMKGGVLCGSALLNGDPQLFDRYWREDYGDELCYGAKTFPRYYGNFGIFLWLQYILENFIQRF
jgi:geranylgeranyl reductase